MKKAILAIILCHLALWADVTGNWSGTVKMKRDGADQSDAAHLILKQEGSTVTGSIGVHSGDMRPIENGKIQGDQITFEVATNNGSYKVALKLQEGGDTLTGDVRGDGPEPVAQLEMKRSK